METQQQLLKLFAQSLRNRANGTNPSLNTQLLRYLSRKDLIHIIKDLHNGNLPKEMDLIEKENEALLKLIGNDFAIISYMTSRWSKKQKTSLHKHNTSTVVEKKSAPKESKKQT